MKKGEKAPEFCLKSAEGADICLSQFQGTWVVLYFYPKDNTSGCTLEAVDFTRHKKNFNSLDTEVMGISPDSQKSHCNFRDKNNLTITLLSDPEHKVIEEYGAWVLKKMYGREYYGVQRSTYIIDTRGVIAHAWGKVKVSGHVETVLKTLKELQSG